MRAHETVTTEDNEGAASVLENFSSLWNSEAAKYVLVRLCQDSSEIDDCLIFNRETKSAKLIEDFELAREVRQRMVNAGVKIVDQIPTD